jgi:protein-S-isoprenylcysteine O-methyltransferase Ste14
VTLKRLSIRQVLTYLAAAAALWFARPQRPTFLLGSGLAALGVAVRIWGCGHLRKNEQLVTSGPYAHVQHPLYLGTFFISLGLIIAGGSPQRPGLFLWVVGGPLFVALFFGYYLSKKRRVEADRLRGRFGEDFDKYASVVPRFFPSLQPYAGRSSAGWSWPVFVRNHEIGMDLLIGALFAALWFTPRGF